MWTTERELSEEALPSDDLHQHDQNEYAHPERPHPEPVFGAQHGAEHGVGQGAAGDIEVIIGIDLLHDGRLVPGATSLVEYTHTFDHIMSTATFEPAGRRDGVAQLGLHLHHQLGARRQDGARLEQLARLVERQGGGRDRELDGHKG